MAKVTTISKTKMLAISALCIVAAALDGLGRLVFTRVNGTTITLNQVKEFPFQNNESLVTQGSFDKGYPTMQIPEFSLPGTPNQTFSPSSTLGCVDAVWSTDSWHCYVITSSAPYLYFYRRKITFNTLLPYDWEALTGPATAPAGVPTAVTVSPDGQYVAVTHATTPFVTIYKRSSAATPVAAAPTLTKLTNPSTLPTGNATGVIWSKDGVYLVVTHNTAPFMTIYKQAGDVFTKLADPSSTPGAAPTWVSFCPNTTHLTVGMSASPYMYTYKRSGDTFTRLADPATLTGAGTTRLMWDPTGVYLAIVNATSPFLHIYKRSGDVLTKLPNPGFLPASAITDVEWSPDSKFLFLASTTGITLHCYRRVGDSFRKYWDAASTFATQLAMAPDGTLMTSFGASSCVVQISANAMGAGYSKPLAVVS